MAIQKITGDVIATSAVTADSLADTTITAAKLHTTLDLTGKTVTVATASAGDNDTTVASTAFVSTAVANLADSAPSTLDTLNELAAALGDDANFSTTVTNSIATKLPLAGGTLTGALVVTGDANPALEISRGSANTTNVNLKYNTTLTGQLAAANAEFQISAAGSNTPTTFFTNGSERMRIDASGNVGIGTDSPSRPLEIKASSAAMRLQQTGGAYAEITSSDFGILYLNADAGNTASGTSMRFLVDNSEKMRINSSGKVGIGTDNPSRELHVYKSSGNVLAQIQSGSSGIAALILQSSAGASTIYTGVGSSQGFQFYADGTNEAMRIASSGKVGIGTDSPNEALEVSGNIQFTTSVGTTSDRPAVTAATLANGEIRAKNADGGDGGLLRLSAGGGTNANQVSYIDIQGYSNSTGIGPKSVIIGTQGTDRIVVDSLGNVGIGETEPTSRLHVTNATNIDMSGGAAGQLRIEGAGYSGAIALNGDAMHIYQNSSGRSIVFGNNETEQVRIKHNGYVGIGTDSPLDLLHLETTSGDVRQLMNAPAGSDAEIKLAEGGSVVYTIGHDAASSEFRIGTTNVDTDVFLRGKSAGNISIGRGGQQDGLAGVQVLRGGLLINGGVNDMGATDSHYSNVWTWVGCSGVSGTFNGAVRVNIPDVTGSAGSVGYGGFSIEVYVAGYSGKYCHAFLSGYNNTGITLSENAIRASSGGWSTSYGMVGTQGFYFDINYPSGLIHPSIYIRVSKGGHTAAGKGTDFNDVNVNWT